MEETQDTPKTVEMIGPETTTAVAVAGETYEVSEKGTILAKVEHTAALLEHGFVQFVEKIVGKAKK